MQIIKGAFTYAVFSLVELSPGAISSLLLFICAGESTAITLRSGQQQSC